MASRSEKALDKVERQRGWTTKELVKLYESAGFVLKKETRSPHPTLYHPEYPQLLTTVSRTSKGLPPGYRATAKSLLKELIRLENESKD